MSIARDNNILPDIVHLSFYGIVIPQSDNIALQDLVKSFHLFIL